MGAQKLAPTMAEINQSSVYGVCTGARHKAYEEFGVGHVAYCVLVLCWSFSVSMAS